MLLAFPFAFTEEIDARAVHQLMPRILTGAVAQLHLQVFLVTTEGAEIWHRPLQLGHLQQTLHHAKRLAQRLVKKALDAQAELDRCIREKLLAPTLAAGLSQTAHFSVQPDRQRSACLERRVVLRPIYRAVAWPSLIRAAYLLQRGIYATKPRYPQQPNPDSFLHFSAALYAPLRLAACLAQCDQTCMNAPLQRSS